MRRTRRRIPRRPPPVDLDQPAPGGHEVTDRVQQDEDVVVPAGQGQQPADVDRLDGARPRGPDHRRGTGRPVPRPAVARPRGRRLGARRPWNTRRVVDRRRHRHRPQRVGEAVEVDQQEEQADGDQHPGEGDADDRAPRCPRRAPDEVAQGRAGLLRQQDRQASSRATAARASMIHHSRAGGAFGATRPRVLGHGWHLPFAPTGPFALSGRRRARASPVPGERQQHREAGVARDRGEPQVAVVALGDDPPADVEARGRCPGRPAWWCRRARGCGRRPPRGCRGRCRRSRPAPGRRRGRCARSAGRVPSMPSMASTALSTRLVQTWLSSPA